MSVLGVSLAWSIQDNDKHNGYPFDSVSLQFVNGFPQCDRPLITHYLINLIE